MKTFYLVILIFIAEVINSYCADSRGVAVIQRRAFRADLYDTISSIITVGIPFIIFVVERNLMFGIPVVMASVIGTHLAARRYYFKMKPPFLFRKQFKKKTKKAPFSTA